MYIPKHFSENNLEICQRIMREHPFASLVTVEDGQPEVNHVPLVLSEDAKFLRGHLARGNQLARDSNNAKDILVVFHGPHAYVTPTWYPSKQPEGKVVPTWNYIVVQVKGVMRIIHDPQWLLKNVDELSTHHEVLRHSEWRVNDAPDDYLKMMMRGIVGIEIEIRSVSGKFKLSQNRSQADHQGVMQGLLSVNDTSTQEKQVAQWMQEIGLPK